MSCFATDSATDADADDMAGLSGIPAITSAVAAVALDAAMTSGASVQPGASTRRARKRHKKKASKRCPGPATTSPLLSLSERKEILRNLAEEAREAFCERRRKLKKIREITHKAAEIERKKAEKQAEIDRIEAEKAAEIDRIEAEKAAEVERVLKELLEHQMLKQVCIRMNSYFYKDRRSIEQFLQAIPSAKRPNGPNTLGAFDWIDAAGDVRNQVFHLLGTRGWELERINKHAKYSRKVELTVDGTVLQKTQVVFISVSPSDWRAPDKVVKDLHDAEREVVRVLL